MKKANSIGSRKKIAFFDFDGTLVDTITDAGRCFNKALEFFGFDPYPLDQYGKVVGGNLEIIFSKLLNPKDRTEENISKLKEKYKEIYAEDEKPSTKPFEGIVEVLKSLNENNILIAISTNKAQILTEQLVENLFPKIDFLSILGYCDERPSKPDPTSIEELMFANDVDKDEAVFIGDGLTDVKTAENAKVDCILVTWGQGEIKTLSKEKAVSFVAHSPNDILDFIDGQI